MTMWDLKDYRMASNPAHAVELMQAGPGVGRYIAGGTDLILEKPDCDFVVDISGAGLDDVVRTNDGDLFMGAATTLENLTQNPLVTGFAGGALSRMAHICCNRPVRTNATVGGNLCSALPSADMAPVLLALDAACFVMGHEEQESMALADFFVGPRLTVLDGRLLMGLALPGIAAGWRCHCHKFTRSAEDISLIQVAVALGVEDEIITDARIALGAVAPVPMRSALAENLLTDRPLSEITPEVMAEVGEMAAGESEPIDDHRASAEYRRDMVRVLTRRLLERAVVGGAS